MSLFSRKKVQQEVTALAHEVDVEVRQLKDKVRKDEDCNTQVLVKVNALLQHMTQMDYVKEMIQDANKQAEMVENAAASSEEMSATTEGISNFVQESHATAVQSTQSSLSAINMINAAFERIEVTMSKTSAVNETMKHVNAETAKINDMVGIIKSVADQTNLLALNAAIEAARAGEYGRGFAVVADEIKKLAENTKQQVEFIQKTVSSLNQEIIKTSTALDEVTNTFVGSKDMIHEAVDALNGINGALVGIGNSFMEISANVEEQTAASQEMSSSLMVINDKSKVLKDEAIKTGLSFYDISKLIDEIRIIGFEHADSLDHRTQIEICICDHLMWRWRVYNMILGYVVLDEKAVGTHQTCRLGKWVALQESSGSKITGHLNRLNKPHADLHDLAKKAIQAYNNKDLAGAERNLELMDLASKNVIQVLKEIKEV